MCYSNPSDLMKTCSSAISKNCHQKFIVIAQLVYMYMYTYVYSLCVLFIWVAFLSFLHLYVS